MNFRNLTDDEVIEARDAAIEPVLDALEAFVLLDREYDARSAPDALSINRERFTLLWISEILRGCGIDAERADQSLRDDGLTLHDDPLLEINWQHRRRSPPSGS